MDYVAAPPPLRKLATIPVEAPLETLLAQGPRLFYTTNKSYGALDLRTRRKLWEVKSGNGTALAADTSTLYVGERSGLRACDPRTGRVLWRLPLSPTHYVVRSEKTLLHASHAGLLTALELPRRRVRWRVDFHADLVDKPVVQGNRVLAGTNDGDLRCLDASTGNLLWKRTFPKPTQKRRHALYSLRADQDRVYVFANQGLLALAPQTGKTLWQAQKELSVWPHVLSHQGRLYLHSSDTLYALEARDGHLLWSQEPSESRTDSLSPPLLWQGQLLLSAQGWLYAYSLEGKKLGQWDTEQYLVDKPLTALGGNLVVPGPATFLVLGPGKPLGPPDDPSARQALAQQLVARFGKWSWDDRTMFPKLGEAGFAALLPLVRRELQKPAEKALDRRDLLEHLGEVMSPAHTGELLELLPLIVKTSEIDYARRTALGLLAEHGDERARPFFWSELQKGPDAEAFGGAIPYFIRRPDPEVIAFLVDALDNPKADRRLRAAAFFSLPSMGDPSVLPNLRAARPHERTLPSVASFYKQLDKPFDTAKDANGTLWGLLHCPAAGDYEDLWIARRQDNQWTDFLFTSSSTHDFNDTFPSDWVTRFVQNPALRVDSDGDGLTDVLEARLGTNPNNPDTDGDGIPDSQDKNPLAGKLPSTDEEKILAAAFESQFGFDSDRGLPMIVAFPPGIAPFELPSAGWLVLPKASSPYWGKSRYSPRGHVLVSFVDTVRSKRPVFRWSADHTEVTVHLGITYGAMDGIGYDIRVRKFRNDWFVIETHASWFS